MLISKTRSRSCFDHHHAVVAKSCELFDTGEVNSEISSDSNCFVSCMMTQHYRIRYAIRTKTSADRRFITHAVNMQEIVL